MKLLVVILNYKVTDLTIACLRALSPEIASVPGAHDAVLENGTGERAADKTVGTEDEDAKRHGGRGGRGGETLNV